MSQFSSSGGPYFPISESDENIVQGTIFNGEQSNLGLPLETQTVPATTQRDEARQTSAIARIDTPSKPAPVKTSPPAKVVAPKATAPPVFLPGNENDREWNRLQAIMKKHAELDAHEAASQSASDISSQIQTSPEMEGDFSLRDASNEVDSNLQDVPSEIERPMISGRTLSQIKNIENKPERVAARPQPRGQAQKSTLSGTGTPGTNQPFIRKNPAEDNEISRRRFFVEEINASAPQVIEPSATRESTAIPPLSVPSQPQTEGPVVPREKSSKPPAPKQETNLARSQGQPVAKLPAMPPITPANTTIQPHPAPDEILPEENIYEPKKHDKSDEVSESAGEINDRIPSEKPSSKGSAGIDRSKPVPDSGIEKASSQATPGQTRTTEPHLPSSASNIEKPSKTTPTTEISVRKLKEQDSSIPETFFSAPEQKDDLSIEMEHAVESQQASSAPAQKQLFSQNTSTEDKGSIEEDTEKAALPLEAVWPVTIQRKREPSIASTESALKQPPKKYPPESNKLGEADTTSQGETLVDENRIQEDSSLRRLVSSISIDQVTDSEVDIITPLHPRPSAPTSKEAQVSTEKGSERQASIQKSEASEPTIEPNSASNLVEQQSETIPTEIGPLPKDLWQLIGQPLPSNEPRSSTPLESRFQEKPKIEKTSRIAAPETASAGFVPADSMQRQDAQSERVSSAGSSNQPTLTDQDKKELSRRVYSEIKRRLAIEWERLQRK